MPAFKSDINIFDTYQDTVIGLANYPDAGHNMVYPALGLAGEAGEAADKVKKFWRNRGITNGAELTEGEREALAKELGDVLWYITALAHELGLTLHTIARMNIEKLTDRHARGVIKSEGDNR
jgi:NTP pyrophosphatase (non-canonical NTP hydrolase)